MDSNSQLYDENIRPIESIEFNVLGNKQIKEMSAFGKESSGIEIADLYDNLEPKKGGLIDTRLGSTNNGVDCATCGFDSTNCIGHFGHIDLAEPVFHIGYIAFIKKILSFICLRCSKLLLYKNEEEILELLKDKSPKARFAAIRELTKNITYCMKPGYGCGTPVSKIKIESKKGSDSINIISELQVQNQEGADTNPENQNTDGKKKIIRQILTPEICYDIFKNMSDTDCSIIGLDPKKTRPEYMIHKVFPVSPVSIRPSAKVDFMESSSKEDDLTHKLADIVKANIKIRKFKESVNETTAKYGIDHVHLLQFHIHTNFDNESSLVSKSEQRNKATKSLSSRLKGKEGRLRGNLMGKRVNFSARTVITSDPTINFNELRVPFKIATNLTFPEVVTPQNIEYLSQLVKNGRDVYPGANFVFPSSNMDSGRRVLPIDLRFRKEKVELRYGDTVERHLIDGDVVLLNRQPSLHKMSMMGHKIVVVMDKRVNTFGLSTPVCGAFNADFDGDEIKYLSQTVGCQ